MRFPIWIRVVPAAGILILAAVPLTSMARAEEFAGDIPDRIWVDLGGQANELTTQVSVSGARGVGATLNFEDAFDMPTGNTTVRLLGTVRISEQRRWIDFGYENINRSGSKIIQQDINWGDYTFSAGSNVTAGFNSQFIYTAFRYDFLHEDKIRISGSAGISYVHLAPSLAASGGITGPNGPINGSFENSNAVNAPVPLFGLNFDWALTKRLVVRSYNRLFRIRIAGADGGMYENGIHLNWYFVKHFGLGVGVDRSEIRVNTIRLTGDTIGKFDYVVSGIGVYVNLAF